MVLVFYIWIGFMFKTFDDDHVIFGSIGVPLYPQVIHFQTYSGYVKLRIIPNAICNVIFV
jgi:hypothetical protein